MVNAGVIVSVPQAPGSSGCSCWARCRWPPQSGIFPKMLLKENKNGNRHL